MAKRCKHLNTTVRYEPALSTSCDRCGEQLSLGPSNDEPAEVRIEMRAAEVARDPQKINAWERPARWRDDAHVDDHHAFAGWLAREIATHDDRDTRDANAWSWDPTRGVGTRRVELGPDAWSWDPTRPAAGQYEISRHIADSPFGPGWRKVTSDEADELVAQMDGSVEIEVVESEAPDPYDDSDHQPYCDSLKDCALECNCSLADAP